MNACTAAAPPLSSALRAAWYRFSRSVHSSAIGTWSGRSISPKSSSTMEFSPGRPAIEFTATIGSDASGPESRSKSRQGPASPMASNSKPPVRVIVPRVPLDPEETQQGWNGVGLPELSI